MGTGNLKVLLLALAACGGSSGKPDGGTDARLEGFAEPDIYCPGGPKCTSAGDGVLNVQDIFDFLGAWFSGCP